MSTKQIDARGPRFGAAITTVVLAIAFLNIDSSVGNGLIFLQTFVFALGSLVGLQAQPYGLVFTKVVKPRLSAATVFEDAAPPRFAQSVGFGFALAAVAGIAVGSSLVTQIAVGFALVAAFLNAAFNFCLGCEMYLALKRLTSRAA